MHKCSHLEEKKEYCYVCVLDLQALQNKVVEQFMKRFSFIWRRGDDKTKRIALEAELKYSLVPAQTLASVPIEEDSEEGYTRAIRDTFSLLKELKKEYPKAYIQCLDESFIIYNNTQHETISV